MKRALVAGSLLSATFLSVEWRESSSRGDESITLSVSSSVEARKKRRPPPPPPPAAPAVKEINPEVDAMLKFVRENFGKLKGLLTKAQEQVRAGKPVEELLGGGGSAQSPAQSPTPAAPETPAAPDAPTTPGVTPAPPVTPAAGGDQKKQLKQARKALAKLAKSHLSAAKPILNKIKQDVMDSLGVQRMKADALLDLVLNDQFFAKLKTAFGALATSVKNNFPALKAAFLKFLNEAKDMPELRDLAGQCNGLLQKGEDIIRHCGRIVGERKIDIKVLNKIRKHGKDCGRALVGIVPAVQGCFATFRKADAKVAQVEAEPDL
ncbi:MAG: hypothetical protein HYY84_11145 [Deltaproteobacteria bacterium]|nr:hypothetical protein [Deltaproteobacteria bacterium]